MLLCTGNPCFTRQGESLVLTVPSGKENVEIAFTLHQAFWLEREAHNAVGDFHAEHQPDNGADVISFPHMTGRA